jgi:hypothetical protein
MIPRINRLPGQARRAPLDGGSAITDIVFIATSFLTTL